jgi:hypothetical protein
MVQAEPMTLGEYHRVRGRLVNAEVVEASNEGYMVTYPDGYVSWSPREVFDAAYFPLTASDSITISDTELFVDDFITSKLGTKTAVVQARCLTGYELTETSSCVSVANYDQQKGTAFALEKIKNRLWSHLGFVLQWAIHGLK